MRARRHLTRKLRNRMKSIVSVLLASSMVLSPMNGISIAAGSERESSRIDISGLIDKKVNISLDSEDLKTAALAAIQEGNVYDVGNYLSTDNATDAAFENLMNEDSPFYELRLWSSDEEAEMEDNGVDVKILVQRDTEETQVPETRATRSELRSSDVSFRYDAHDAKSSHELAFYQPGGVLGNLLIDFQADQLYHETAVNEDAADSTYELTGDETITILYMNTDKAAHTFKLSVDGKTFSTGIKTAGTESLAKQILQKLKKTMKEDLSGTTEAEETLAAESTEATTAAASNASDASAVTEPTGIETTTAVTIASASEIPTTEAAEETTTAAEETTAAELTTTAAEETTVAELTTAVAEETTVAELATAVAEETTAEETTAAETTVAETPAVETAAAETTEAEKQEKDAAIASPSEIPTEATTEKTEETTAAETKVITDMDESLADERKETLKTVTAKDIAAEITSAKLVQYSLADITGDFKSADLGAYLVKVYPVTENAIDADWKLEVKELLRDDQEAKADNAEENSEQMSEATRQALTDAGIYDNSRSLDIKLVDSDGNKVEPRGTVRVEIEVAKELLDEENATSFSVYHLEETTDGSIHDVKEMNSSTEALDTDGTIIADSNAIVTATVENTEAIAAVSVTEDENSTETVATETIKKLSDTVATMKTAFTVDNFSTFTITWENSSSTLTIITEDEGGNELQAYGQSSIKLQEGVTYNFNEDDSHFFVPYHAVKDAYYGTDAKPVTSAQLVGDKVVLYNNGTVVDQGTKVTVHVRYREDIGQNILAASLNDTGDAPTHTKTLTSNDDGTYTLALDVTGKSSASTSTTKANVIVIFDKSGSMLTPVIEEQVSSSSLNQNGVYFAKVNGEYERLYLDWRGWYYQDSNGNARYYFGPYYAAKKSREDVAKEATKNLASKLIEEDSIETLSLIQFSNIASRVDYEKNNSKNPLSAFNTAVDNISSGGGTNWEAALELAYERVNEIKSSNADAPCYVVFVSDGDPTFRYTQMYSGRVKENDYNSSYYDKYNNRKIYGTGNSDVYDYNYNAALIQGKKLAANSEFYTLAIFGSVSKMDQFTKDSYLNDQTKYAGHYYSADTVESLNQAFDDIAKRINHAYSYKSIRIADTLTKDTAIADNPEFTYEIKTKVTEDGKDTYTTYAFKIDSAGKIQDLKKKNSDGTEVSVTEIPTFTDSNTGKTYSNFKNGLEFPAAGYEESTKSVIWDLGDEFVLPDGWTFTVKFNVWPSQTAYDHAATWKNNENSTDSTGKFDSKTYGTDTEGYVERTESGETKYYLYSNAAAQLDYKTVSYTDGSETSSSDLQNASYTKPDPMPLNVTKLTIEKKWVGGDVNHREEVMVQFGDEEIKLNSDNSWTATRYLAPGLEVTDPTDSAKKITRDAGHEYTISETAVKSYTTSYTLNGTEVTGSSVTVKPMLVDSANNIKDAVNSYNAWAADAKVTVTNTYNPPIPTGVYKDVRPYVTALVIALAGAALLLLENEERKRMSR